MAGLGTDEGKSGVAVPDPGSAEDQTAAPGTGQEDLRAENDQESPEKAVGSAEKEEKERPPIRCEDKSCDCWKKEDHRHCLGCGQVLDCCPMDEMKVPDDVWCIHCWSWEEKRRLKADIALLTGRFSREESLIEDLQKVRGKLFDHSVLAKKQEEWELKHKIDSKGSNGRFWGYLDSLDLVDDLIKRYKP